MFRSIFLKTCLETCLETSFETCLETCLEACLGVCLETYSGLHKLCMCIPEVLKIIDFTHC